MNFRTKTVFLWGFNISFLVGAGLLTVALWPEGSVILFKQIYVVSWASLMSVMMGIYLLYTRSLYAVLRYIRHSPTLVVLLLLFLSLSVTFFRGENLLYKIPAFLFQQDSIVLFWSLFVLFAAAVVFVRTHREIIFALRAFLGAAFVSSLVQLFFIFSQNDLASTTLLGTPANFSIYLGFAILLSILCIEVVLFKDWWLVLAWGTLLSSLTALVLVSFVPVWLFLLFFTFFIAVVVTSNHLKRGSGMIPMSAVIVLLVSLLFVITPSERLESIIQVPTNEIRPSTYVTMSLMGEYYDNSNPTEVLFGSGAGTFTRVWNTAKPQFVQSSNFGLIDFENGASSMLTYGITFGLFGLFSWIFFLGSYFYEGVAWTSKRIKEEGSEVILAPFILSIYLWIWIFIYVPSASLLALAFVVTGVTLSLMCTHLPMQPTNPTSFLNRLIPGLRYPIVSLLILLGSFTLYGLKNIYPSVLQYERGVKATEERLHDLAVVSFDNAILLKEYDLYYRTRSQLRQLQIEEMLRGAEQVLTEKESQLFGDWANSSVGDARTATTLDENNYLNWVVLGNAYAQLTLLGIPGADNNGQEAYKTATDLAPKNPIPLFLQARIIKDKRKALDILDIALALKHNYTPAVELRKTLWEEIKNNDRDVSI